MVVRVLRGPGTSGSWRRQVGWAEGRDYTVQELGTAAYLLLLVPALMARSCYGAARPCSMCCSRRRSQPPPRASSATGCRASATRPSCRLVQSATLALERA